MSSSLKVLSVLLVVLSTSFIIAEDEDFAFDVSDDFEIEFPDDETLQSQFDLNDMVATVGHIFHFAIPTNAFDQKVDKYEAKSSNGAVLPSWLMFEKSSGVFWGIPLQNDVETLYISVHGVQPKETKPIQFKITVKESQGIPSSHLKKCSEDETITLLTLVIDKSLSSIKPKQRVMAINNIAKFFGLPYSAFSLTEDRSNGESGKPVVLLEHDSSRKQKSKLTTLIQVPVGCDGRVWLHVVPLVHQLKKQVKDGTISNVMKLPATDWKIINKTPPPVIRQKRYIDETGGPAGSGDYEDYEYDYDGDDYDDTEGGEEEGGRDAEHSVTKLPSQSSTTVSVVETETHPHRHHHGETRPVEEEEPEIRVVKVPTLAEPSPTSPVTRKSEDHGPSEHTISWQPTERSSTTRMEHTSEATTTSTTATSPIYVSEEITDNEQPITQRTNIYRPIDVPDEEEEDYGDDYEDSTDDADYDENVTEVPTNPPNKITPKTEPTSVETTRMETTRAETPSPSSSSSSEASNTNPQPEVTQFEPEVTPTFTTTVQESSVIPIYKVPFVESTVFTNTTTPTPSTEYTTSPSRTTIVFDDLTTNNDNLTTTSKHSTQRHTLVTQQASSTSAATTVSSTITSTVPTTETTMIEVRNYPPTIQNRLNSIAVTAGKVFEYVIPENTFIDVEDGNNLRLELLDHEGNMVGKNSWCQYNPRERKIYGLPIEEDVSGWEYILKATDSEGASVSDHLKIRVQHHKSRRAVNHEFSLHVFVEKKYEFPHTIDWALRVLRGLGTLYSLGNLSDITVRRIEHNKEPMVLTWTNDSLPKDFCPKAEILNLFSILTSNDRGDPSKALSLSLAPEIRVKKVAHKLIGICESQPPAPSEPTNFPPILRNAVDHINASVGELLVYRVPDDTFYDPEDVEGRNLRMFLLTSDRKPLPPDNWLQFDSKNREFYGIPLPKNVGRTEYTLICEDSGGLTAPDSLVVAVHQPARVNYNMEFSMTVETDYETFATSPNMQRKFIEKLRDLFEDRDTNNIHLTSISKGSTIVSWYNKSLPVTHCPKDEIRRLEAVLIYSDRSINSRVYDIMRPEFSVSRINFQPLAACKTRPIVAPTPEVILPPDDSSAQESHEEYLVTFIVPAVIIAVMLLLAGIAACILYRRRRSGKMNVEEDGRQSYGNKGIPVIFQEELEEKPDPGTKAPIILKDEKPPLAPPEYSKSGSLKMNDDSEPYHPPPPFTRTQDNGKQSRPKPTPTYRKPPPYVPP
ncbi:uncharacterized protein LOC108735390 isoform X2 [Agrilus planipennis]|uniref:Dystroglycan 1 n=1 Tax=Agrilus planipennis TaxID=224129 RepID=A0A7F5R4C4_AGRPL|nr:uncharacterized protein LOC108735390 isoform X2 [Agrilus planipennis]